MVNIFSNFLISFTIDNTLDYSLFVFINYTMFGKMCV